MSNGESDKPIEARVKALEQAVAQLRAESVWDRDVYIQNKLASDPRGYNLQNDCNGGSAFVHANPPEPGQVMRIHKKP